MLEIRNFVLKTDGRSILSRGGRKFRSRKFQLAVVNGIEIADKYTGSNEIRTTLSFERGNPPLPLRKPVDHQSERSRTRVYDL